MEWVEVTGRTLEDAKEAALDQLGVDEQDAEFEVLEEPRAGLFGRLRSEARVRARVLPTAPRPKLDRRDRRRGRRRPAEARPGHSGEARPRPSTRDSRDETEEARVSEDAGETSEAGGPEDVSLEEQGDAAREFLAGLVEVFGLEASVSVAVVDEDSVEVHVAGDDLGLLIGPKGQTLSAVQELARTVVQRRLGARHGRVMVDVSDYRRRRRDALERFSRQVADEVRSSGVARVLEAMPAADRKIVHDAITDVAGVTTTSEGEEPRRRVVIAPDTGAPGD